MNLSINEISLIRSDYSFLVQKLNIINDQNNKREGLIIHR